MELSLPLSASVPNSADFVRVQEKLPVLLLVSIVSCLSLFTFKKSPAPSLLCLALGSQQCSSVPLSFSSRGWTSQVPSASPHSPFWAHSYVTPRSSEMDPALQMSPTSTEVKDPLSCSDGNTLPNSTQDAVEIIWCKDTVLAHVQFFDPRIFRSSSAKLLSSLPYDRGVFPFQLFSVCLYWILWGLCLSTSPGCWDLTEISSDSLLTRVFTIESNQFGQTQFALGKSSGAESPSPSFPSHDNYGFQEHLLQYLPRSCSKADQPGDFSLLFMKAGVMPAFFQSVSGSVHLMKPMATVLCSLFLTKDPTLLK